MQGEQFAAQNADYFTKPGASTGFANTAGGILGQRGATETYNAQQGRSMQGPGASAGQYANTQDALAGRTDTQNFRKRNRGTLESQGQGEQFYSAQQGKFNMPTNSQQAYDGLQSAPGFDAFYDRARERQAGGMNDQLAARGQYGSSAGVDQISQGMSDLNAQQANREADFMLSQQGQALQGAQQADMSNQGILGMQGQFANQAQGQGLARLGLGGSLAGQSFNEQLGRESLFGQQAGQADSSAVARFGAGLQGSQAADQATLARMGLQGDLISQGEGMDFNRMMGGAEVAAGAQDLTQGRLQEQFNNMLTMGDRGAGLYGSYAGSAFADYGRNTDAAIAYEAGIPAEMLNNDRYNAEEYRANVGTYGNIINNAGATAVPG
jgi:hypothetical protein